MTALLKTAGKGIMYVFVLPLGIIVLAAFAVFGLGIFAFIGIKSFYLFFTGRSLEELPEDTKARLILEKQKAGSMVDSFDQETEETNVQEELKNKISNDFSNNYYIPLDSSIPTPSNNTEEKKEEVPNIERPDLGGDDHVS